MFTIRAARIGDETGIAEVHVASWRTSYSGLIPDSFLESLSVEKRAEGWKKTLHELMQPNPTRTVLVCEDAFGKIQGFVAGGPERQPGCDFDSELYAIYLYQDQQGNGLGRRLISAFASWLQQNGYKKMRLWVLEKNPSRRFYESAGGELLSYSKTVEFGGTSCLEVAYGWTELDLLISNRE